MNFILITNQTSFFNISRFSIAKIEETNEWIHYRNRIQNRKRRIFGKTEQVEVKKMMWR